METVFLITFFVGFGLTVVSVLLGALGGLHVHLGDGGGHAGHVDMGHGGHAGHVHAGDPGHTHALGQETNAVSPINYQSLVAFLMGFGGLGYIAERMPWAVPLLVFPLAILGGLFGGWLMYRFLRFLLRGEQPMPPTNHVGIVGHLTVGIREGGTGELVYTQHRTKKVASARSADGRPLTKGTEVVVLRYEEGVAYVQPVHELMDGDRR